jgi:hypothetical protein
VALAEITNFFELLSLNKFKMNKNKIILFLRRLQLQLVAVANSWPSSFAAFCTSASDQLNVCAATGNELVFTLGVQIFVS